MPENPHSLDLVGIGIGPFNLSVAAQLENITEIKARFFDKRDRFDWHPGMMLGNVELQTSFLKDLVTATNPTNRWSFLSYLVAHKRFYEFLNAEFDATPRKEFAKYLAWAADGLSNLQFSTFVREISFGRNLFNIRTDEAVYAARHVALGIGLEPYVPSCARGCLGPRSFHSAKAKQYLRDGLEGRVVVVGGGQSGAEIVLHLLSQETCKPDQVTWISRRPNFEPLDATPFVNEYFTPDYVERFRHLGEERRQAHLSHQKLASDGISASTLRALYRRLYTLRHLDETGLDVILMPNREVIQADRRKDEFQLVIRNGFDGGIEIVTANTVIWATGYGFRLPDFLEPVRPLLSLDRHGHLNLGDNFCVKWDGPRSNQIFALNAGRHSYGIAEPQLSLMAWRSAVIVNAILGRPYFDLESAPPLVRWASREDVHEAATGTAMPIAG
jgi:lysine N6-hydroxylase